MENQTFNQNQQMVTPPVNKSKKTVFVIAGIITVIVIGIIVCLLVVRRGGIPSTPENQPQASQPAADLTQSWKEFRSEYDYSFRYPQNLEGGIQNLDAQSKDMGLLEVVVLRSPKDTANRLLLYFTLEEPPILKGDLEKTAQNAEIGWERGGEKPLVKLSSKKITSNGSEFLENEYTSEDNFYKYTTIRFADNAGRPMFLMIVLKEKNAESLQIQEQIFNSIKINQP